MEVPTRRLTAALSDGTVRYPEEIALVATGLLVVAGVVVALRVVDLVIRLWTPSGARGRGDLRH
jgi:hypothetical protein